MCLCVCVWDVVYEWEGEGFFGMSGEGRRRRRRKETPCIPGNADDRGDCKGRRRRVTAGGVCGGGVASDSGRGKSSVSSWSMDALRRMLVQGRGGGRGLLPHFFCFWLVEKREEGRGEKGLRHCQPHQILPPLFLSPSPFSSFFSIVGRCGTVIYANPRGRPSTWTKKEGPLL